MIIFIFVVITGKSGNRILAGALFALIAMAIYVPAGYYLEMALWRRRQAKRPPRAGGTVPPNDDRRPDVHGRARCRRIASSCAQGAGGPALIVDPGDEAERLLRALDELGIETVEAILVTHTHFDHVGAVAPVAQATGAPVYCPELERQVLANIMDYVPWPGFGPFESYEADHTVAGGETLELAGLKIDVIFTPGHSPGHVTYALGGEGAVLRRRAVPGLGRAGRPARRRLADAAGLDRVAGRRVRAGDDCVSGAHGHHHARS